MVGIGLVSNVDCNGVVCVGRMVVVLRVNLVLRIFWCEFEKLLVMI